MKKKQLVDLIQSVASSAGSRWALVDSYGGPSPDGGRESAKLEAISLTLGAVLAAIDGDAKPLKELKKKIG